MAGRRFLKRLGRWGDYSEGGIKDEVFLCRPADKDADDPAARGLSLTLLDPELEAEGFEKYATAFRLPSGDIPGLCFIIEENIQKAGLPPPRFYQDPGPYGHLHYLIDCPDESAANFLAARAFESGILRWLICHRRGPKTIGQRSPGGFAPPA